MDNSLDQIAYQDVISSDGKSYAQLRKELVPAYGKVRLDLLKGYLALALILISDYVLLRYSSIPRLLFVLPSALLLGYSLAYLHLFVHAGAHYDLHPVKSVNDRIADLFIGVFFGIRIKQYRKIHWQHHTLLGTKQDSEHSYFNELNSWLLIKSITGIHTLAVLMSRRKNTEKSDSSSSTLLFKLYTLAFHAGLLGLLFAAGRWGLVITWVAAMIIVFPLFATIRQLMEHRDIAASGKIDYSKIDHGKVNRLFGNGPLDSSFGAAGFNKHLLHHWDPSISYTCLNEVEKFLTNCPETSAIIHKSKTSYLKTFVALFKI